MSSQMTMSDEPKTDEHDVLDTPARPMPPVLLLCGTLMLDLKTIETAPGFFALQALMLRHAGMQIHVLEEADGKHEVGYRAAMHRIPFNEASYYTSKDNPRAWKLKYALGRLKHGPVLWPDIDFVGWTARDGHVDNIAGLTILSWTKLMRDGIPGPVRASA